MNTKHAHMKRIKRSIIITVQLPYCSAQRNSQLSLQRILHLFDLPRARSCTRTCIMHTIGNIITLVSDKLIKSGPGLVNVPFLSRERDLPRA